MGQTYRERRHRPTVRRIEVVEVATSDEDSELLMKLAEILAADDGISVRLRARITAILSRHECFSLETLIWQLQPRSDQEIH